MESCPWRSGGSGRCLCCPQPEVVETTSRVNRPSHAVPGRTAQAKWSGGEGRGGEGRRGEERGEERRLPTSKPCPGPGCPWPDAPPAGAASLKSPGHTRKQVSTCSSIESARRQSNRRGHARRKAHRIRECYSFFFLVHLVQLKTGEKG